MMNELSGSIFGTPLTILSFIIVLQMRQFDVHLMSLIYRSTRRERKPWLTMMLFEKFPSPAKTLFGKNWRNFSLFLTPRATLPHSITDTHIARHREQHLPLMFERMMERLCNISNEVQPLDLK